MTEPALFETFSDFITFVAELIAPGMEAGDQIIITKIADTEHIISFVMLPKGGGQ